MRTLQERFPDFGLDWEIYVSAPGAEIEEGHELVRAIDESHTEVYGSAPERDTARWFSDASVLTRYGIPTVNYGTSSGLPGRRARREPRDPRAGRHGPRVCA